MEALNEHAGWQDVVYLTVASLRQAERSFLGPESGLFASPLVPQRGLKMIR